MKKRKKFMTAMCAFCIALSGCVYGSGVYDADETTAAAVTEENIVKTNRQAVNNSFEELGEAEPFSSYSYEFTAHGSNYMITAALDETGTGLTLTAEDNTFGFSTFDVTPPHNYAVYIPYSQQYASSVCTVIKNSEVTSLDGVAFDTDLLKIDFYLENFENESLPYTVSRFYSITDGRLAQIKTYDFTELNAAVTDGTRAAKMMTDTGAEYSDYRVMDYIPESCLYQTEPLKFMPPPEVYEDESGRLTAQVVTYTLDMDKMVLFRTYEDITSPDSPYYGYMAHAVAGDIYRYFIATSLNVTDYENFVNVEENGQSYNFFKVDDPRFSTVNELEDYVKQYFSEEMTEKMFLEAPQKYRDIDGELYTVPGDGGIDDTLGQLVITDISAEDNVYTYRTRQEKLSESREISYINGEFVIEVHEDGTFTVLRYRYPYVS